MTMKNLRFQTIAKNSIILMSLLFIACGPKSATESADKSSAYDLKTYVQDDSGYSFEILDSIIVKGARGYHTKMISGTWLDAQTVDQPEWWHYVDIIIPEDVTFDSALLFIGGGTNNDTGFQLPEEVFEKAIASKAVLAQVTNIPFQPLKFIEDEEEVDFYEDALIARGWKYFLDRGAKDEDSHWLARYPMTRAVARAMDVVEEVVEDKQGFEVNDFLISGASKRGWTTWTIAATDQRVSAIAPLVIDLLNIGPSFEHHYKSYGEWSIAVKDYVDYEIMDYMNSQEFDRLLAKVEPYSFKEVLQMPKLIINGSVDEFFAVDSWQFYYDDLMGEKHLQYVPNGNHGLTGTYIQENILSFFNRLNTNQKRPEWTWSVSESGFQVDITEGEDYEISLYTNNNPQERDFRIFKNGKNWKETPLEPNVNHSYSISLEAPKQGYTAAFIEVRFKGENPLILTTGSQIIPDSYKHEAYISSAPLGTAKN